LCIISNVIKVDLNPSVSQVQKYDKEILSTSNSKGMVNLTLRSWSSEYGNPYPHCHRKCILFL